MSDVVGGLYVDLSLSAGQFEAGLKSAGKDLATFGDKAKRAAAMTAAGFTQLRVAIDPVSSKAKELAGVLGGGGIAGLLGAASLAGAVEQVRGAASSISELAAEAEKAGVSFESFQELKYAAEQNKVSVDALSDGLKEMQLRADEFILTGKGSSAEAFQRLGYSAEQLKEKLKDPVSLFEQIIDRLKKFDKEAQIRISDEVFGGTGGEQFVRFLGEGKKSIEESRSEARDLGIVMSNDLGKKAQDLDKQFNIIATVIDQRVKGAVVSVADAIGGWATAAQSFFTAVGNWSGWKHLQMGGTSPDVIPIDQNDPMRAARARLAAGLAAGQQTAVPSREDWLWTPDPNAGKAPPKESKAKAPDDYAREIKQTKERTEALRLEAELVGKSAYEADKARTAQELLNAAKDAGRAITPELTAQVAAEAEAHARATQKLEEAQEAYQRLQQVQGEMASAFSGVVSAIAKGEDAVDALTSSLERMGDMLMDMISQQLFKQLFAGIPGLNFGSLGTVGSTTGATFVGAATGGRIAGPGSGTSDSIPAMLSNGEYVVNAAMARRYGALLDMINSGRLLHLAGGGRASGGGAPAAGGMGGVNVQVVTNAPLSSVTATRGRDGTVRIDAQIDEAVARALSQPGSKSQRTMRGVYGARPLLAGR